VGSIERREYSRPTLTVVNLVPEEAVLQTCKVVGWYAVGPYQGDCLSIVGIQCRQNGS